MKGLTKKDFFSSIKRAGIGGAIASSQILEATKLFIQGELECTAEQLIPISLRHNVLVVRSSHPAYSQKLQEHEDELTKYLHASFGVEITRIQFVI